MADLNVEGQNLTASPLELFDLGLTLAADARRQLTGPNRDEQIVWSSRAVRRAIQSDKMSLFIKRHPLTKAEALTFVSEAAVREANRSRPNLHHITLRSPDGSLWAVGIDDSGNLRTRKQ